MPHQFDGYGDLIDGLRGFADSAGDAADRVENGEAVDRGVEETTRTIALDAERFAPKDTGELAGSIHVEKLADGEWLVIVGADHAKPIEYGSRPHVITPNDAEALRFEIDGQIVFAQRVFHPGNPAQPYLRPAIDAHRQDLARNIADELRQIVLSEL